MVRTWVIAVGLSLVGCAAARGGTRREEPSAAQIYSVGEARYAAGAYDEAVRLWRHALLDLPQTGAYDDLRHKLILRMAYGQLMAWSASHDDEYLYDAKQMLDRYLDRHLALHGEHKRAARERGEVYELLYQVESRLPDPEAVVAAVTPADEPEPASAEEREVEDARDEPEPERSGHGDRGPVRTVVVRRDRPSVDDPEIRARLRDSSTDPFNLNGMGTPRIVVYREPTAMIRTGVIKVGDAAGGRRGDRRVATTLVDAARPGITECFQSANARVPGVISQAKVELVVEPDGAVSKATITDGAIVDLLGEQCVLEAFENASVDGQALASSQSFVVPLTMWMADTILVDEYSGRTFVAGTEKLWFNGIPRWRNPTRHATAADEVNSLTYP